MSGISIFSSMAHRSSAKLVNSYTAFKLQLVPPGFFAGANNSGCDRASMVLMLCRSRRSFISKWSQVYYPLWYDSLHLMRRFPRFYTSTFVLGPVTSLKVLRTTG